MYKDSDNLVQLYNLSKNEKFVITRLTQAINFLSEVGMVMNWAIVTNDKKLTYLNYQALLYVDQTYTSSIALPIDLSNHDKTATELKDLIWRVFYPFLNLKHKVVKRSSIEIYWVDAQRAFAVNLFLIFSVEDRSIFDNIFRRISDSEHRLEDSIEYILD